MAKILLTCVINEKKIERETEENLSLLRFLRDELRMTGTKQGCSKGECGSCTVLIDGIPRKSCKTKIGQILGKSILTIEGLSTEDTLHPLQQAFIDEGAFQCGYCTPGMILKAKALLDKNPSPSDENIKKSLQGNLCRCTGYISVIRAVKKAASITGERQRKSLVVKDSFYGPGLINVSVPDKDGLARVGGGLKFADDIYLDDMLFGKLLLAPYPHAQILSIDTTKAEKMPGVRGVLTARDVPGMNLSGRFILDRPILADKKVRFIGDVIAVAFADSWSLAENAVKKIEVQLRPLEVITDPFEAMKEGSIKIHEDGNILKHTIIKNGDVDRAFKQSDVIVEGRYQTPIVEHGYLEPEAGVAVYESNGGVTIWYGTQWPFGVRDEIARSLSLPIEKVRVIGTPIGGGFGGKNDLTMEPILALGAMKLRRPVKITLTRDESLKISVKRHRFFLDYKLGADKNGRFLGLKAKMVSDAGAYAGLSANVLEQAMVFSGGPYVWPNVDIEGYCVYTNNVLGGAFRGFGVNQVHFALESEIDELASKLKISPFELRLKNAVDVGSQTITGEKLNTSVAIKETIQKAKSALSRSLPQIKSNRKIGIGIAAGFKNVGIGRGFVNTAGAIIELNRDGNLLIRVSAIDMGQGIRTIISQIASEVTGFDYDSIEVITGDTGLIPPGAEAVAQRQTFLCGNAVLYASQRFMNKLSSYVSRDYGVKKERMAVRGNKITLKDDAEKIIVTTSCLAQKLNLDGRKLTIEYTYTAPPTYPIKGDKHAIHRTSRFGKNRGYKNGLGCDPDEYRNYITYSYATHVAIVEADEENGEVRLIKLIAVHDVGRELNRQKIIGQLESSAVMGMGYALSEEFIMKNGINLTGSLRSCGLPTISQVPDIEIITIEDPEPAGPFGAKGISEAATVPTAPAITNAIRNALKVRIRKLPVTRAEILKKVAEISAGTGKVAEK